VYERVLSQEDIAAFGRLTGDLGAHHLARGPDLPIAQGLLVAAVPTKLGGELSFLGRTMRIEFLRPVLAGRRVRAELRIDELLRARRGWSAVLISEVFDEDGELVMRGESEGRLPDAVVHEEELLPAFRARAGIDGSVSWIDVVNGVAAIPYGRTHNRAPADTLAAWRGTCSTKHSLLRALLAEGWPELAVGTWHRIYRIDRESAAELFGQTAAATVPATGLVDVHTYLTVDVGERPLLVDATFPVSTPWAGDDHMPLSCGDGIGIAGGRFPDRTKRHLVALHCDAPAREAFIAALTNR
jgi:acyl dehydratase